MLTCQLEILWVLKKHIWYLWTRKYAMGWTLSSKPKYNRQLKQKWYLEIQHNTVLYSKCTLSCEIWSCHSFVTEYSVILDCCLSTVGKYILLLICLLFHQPAILFDCGNDNSISPCSINLFIVVRTGDLRNKIAIKIYVVTRILLNVTKCLPHFLLKCHISR